MPQKLPTLKKHTVFAAAKINLFLHIHKRLSNGYHELSSLVTFVDIGDVVTVEEADSFSFHVTGTFSKHFNDKDINPFLDSENLVVKAARALSQVTDMPLNVKVTLEKNLPIAAGLGGGSSDAAAAIWGLQELWGVERNAEYLPPLLKKLGADVPVCYSCRPSMVTGIGEHLAPAPDMPEIPIVLVNPMLPCSTEEIFLRFDAEKNQKIEHDQNYHFGTLHDIVKTLKNSENDLYIPAKHVVPEIANIIHALDSRKECLFARMSGSGASCFGLFETYEQAEKASAEIKHDNPDWWVKTGWLNRPERY